MLMQCPDRPISICHGNGRSVVALRGLVGQGAGAGVFGLPPDQRFYAGGSATVRGYRYQSIGPQFPDGNPQAAPQSPPEPSSSASAFWTVTAWSGLSMPARSAANGAPFTGNWRVGAGVGSATTRRSARSGLDIAVPLNKQPNGETFELYLGIGQAF